MKAERKEREREREEGRGREKRGEERRKRKNMNDHIQYENYLYVSDICPILSDTCIWLIT
jgi:hypothetical protein